MQAPPPVPSLLDQLAVMATNVHGALGTTAVDWQKRPDGEQWGLLEVTCHLRDVEREVHQNRFRAIITQENVFLPGVVADDWAVERAYSSQDGPTALAAFLSARQETIDLLESLSPESWQRQGRHAFFGPTSMHELLFLVIRHDEVHWEQIRALLSSQ